MMSQKDPPGSVGEGDVESTVEDLLSQIDFGSWPIPDVSESSSDDDLIHKLSHDLELPLALDDFEPVSTWSSHSPGDIFQTFTSQDSVSSALKSENDFSAEELTQALYPNLVAGQETDNGTISSVLIEDKIIKKEPASPQHFLQMPPSPDDSHDIWELLCGPDIKPNVKALDTPPVTPPQSEGSPPHSPQPLSPAGPTATTVVLSPPHHQHQKQGTNGMTANHMTQPIKVVTITTRNGTGNQGVTKGGRITKTMKIQPKIVTTSTTQPQVISIVNSSSGPKLTLPKTVGTRTLSTGGSARVVQLKPPPPPQVQSRVTTATPTIPSPVPSILTSQITNQPAVLSTQSSVVSPAAPTTPLAPLAPALAPGMKHGNVPDLKALKRQQRMIKNRESASLSRKKKKEYVTALEGNISDLQNENKRLKEDNIRLQQKVSSLESECASLRHALGRSPSRKTTTALFAIIFLLSLNLGPLTGIFLSNESRLSSLKRMMQGVEPSPLGTGFKHRSLLWADEKQASAEEGTIPNLNTNSSSMCPMYINATESLRLETELRGWFENKMDKKKNQKPLLPHPKTREGRNRLNKHKNMREASQKLSKQVGSEVWNALVPPQQPSNKPAPLYHYVHYVEPSTSTEEDTSVLATVPRLTSFLEAIQRRDDTYYVVSFSPDHLLVPATARNDSARPRMSLLMPTPQSMNDSLAPPPNNVALMQIDCEVMHTRLVHVAQELVPPYLRTDRSNTSRTSSEEATTAAPRERRSSRARPRHTLTKPSFPHK